MNTQEWLDQFVEQHPEAKTALSIAWSMGCAAGMREARTLLASNSETEWAENPFEEQKVAA